MNHINYKSNPEINFMIDMRYVLFRMCRVVLFVCMGLFIVVSLNVALSALAGT